MNPTVNPINVPESTQQLMSFDELSAPIQDVLAKAGISKPTDIQQMAFYPALAGKDLLAQSRTGSGKTLAFLLPLVSKLSAKPASSMKKSVRTLVLAPTRELVEQIVKVGTMIGKPVGCSFGAIIGGVSYTLQRQALKQGVDVIVGTPGRVADLIRSGVLSLETLESFVLDEVDQMLDIGFAKELEEIRQMLPGKVQTLFFSATLNRSALAVAKQLLKDPFQIAVKDNEDAKLKIEHRYVLVKFDHQKIKGLISMLLHHQPEQAIIFCETKKECVDLTEALQRNDLAAIFLNSDLSQAQRSQTMNSFKSGRSRFLVATNIAARGIDVQGLPLVVNYAPPRDIESYTHRCGRTGRAGMSGQVWNLVDQSEYRWFCQLLKRVSLQAEQLQLPTENEFLQARLNQEISTIDATNFAAASCMDFINEAIDALNVPKMRDLLKKVLITRIDRLGITNPAALQCDAASIKVRSDYGRSDRDSRFGGGSSRRRSFGGGGHGRDGGRDHGRDRGDRGSSYRSDRSSSRSSSRSSRSGSSSRSSSHQHHGFQ